MKANAPEKIYIRPLPNHSNGYVGVAWYEHHKNMVEYIRTETFIEKACEWLENNLQGIVGGSIYIEDFRKYMEE